MENPKIVLIVGSVGLALNLLVMSFLHGINGHILASYVVMLMKYDQNTTMGMDTAIVIATATAMDMHTAWMLR